MSDKTLQDVIARSLGDSTSYAVYTDKKDETLLNPMPRSPMREDWNIDTTTMRGVDVWHCWEASFLLPTGKPVAGVLKFAYDCHSPFMIESKSMKLYLNSFDMMKLKSSDEYVEIVKRDLSDAIQSPVTATWFAHEDLSSTCIVDYATYSLDARNVDCFDYTAAQHHLQREEGPSCFYRFNALRSRCRHTKQKDTGTAFIQASNIDPISLVRELVSLRELNEFHEIGCEKLFKALIEIDPSANIACFYNRRGSLDINPVRYSGELCEPLTRFINPNFLYKGSQSQ